MLDLRDLGLGGAELLGKLFLRQLPRSAQLLERHSGEQLLLVLFNRGMPGGWLARYQGPELLGHSGELLSSQARKVSVVEAVRLRHEVVVPAVFPLPRQGRSAELWARQHGLDLQP
jgi:hypothetical protein